MILFTNICFSNDKDLEKCIEKDSSTAGMLNCSGIEIEEVDKVLNKNYIKLYKMLDKEGKQELRHAERAWLAFRKAECGFAAYPERGHTMAAFAWDGCFLDMTKKRADYMKNQLKIIKEYGI